MRSACLVHTHGSLCIPMSGRMKSIFLFSPLLWICIVLLSAEQLADSDVSRSRLVCAVQLVSSTLNYTHRTIPLDCSHCSSFNVLSTVSHLFISTRSSSAQRLRSISASSRKHEKIVRSGYALRVKSSVRRSKASRRGCIAVRLHDLKMRMLAQIHANIHGVHQRDS